MTSSLVPIMPRRWSITVDGIRWLPRMIDKAKMQSGGTLGTYLLGHSPVDFALLTRLGIGTDEFASIANREPNDEAVLGALRARGFDEARVRRWSDRFDRTYKTYIRLWDIDEGYREPSGLERPLAAVMHAVERPVATLVRRLLPRP